MTPAAVTAAARRKAQPARGTPSARRTHAKVPRRVSGPARPPAAAPAANRPLGARILNLVRALADHPWLDRAIRGRIWIPALGLLLFGIVTMQVEVLKFGASIGRSLQLTTTLQVRNESLRSSVAWLADDQRLDRLAARSGMVMAPPDGVSFLAAGSRSDVERAIANLHAPNPQAFSASAASRQAATTAGPSTSVAGLPTSPGSGVPPTGG